MRIYIIDDDWDMVQYVTALLESAGHEVHSGVSGVSNLPKIVARKPDAILVDLVMAEMDGIELVGQLRAKKELANTKIIMVTSAAPIRGLANYSMYATGRGAGNAMVKSLSLELAAANIQVNAIAPNYIENPTYFPPELTENEAAMKKMLSNIPAKRLGQPEEVAELIAFFASDKCGFVTGHVVPISGGWA